MKYSLTNIKPVAILTTTATLLLISGLFFIIILRYGPKPNVLPSPSPIVFQTPSPSPRTFTKAQLQQPIGFEEGTAKIKSILPYKTSAYLIEYEESINAINGKILKASNRLEFIKTRQTAEAFLKSKGISDLCTLNIFWLPPQNFDPESLNPTDLLTTNCSAYGKPLSSPKP